jgi:class 3 adenylate cyclase/tetratricopeptide (TPR) repeat protein
VSDDQANVVSAVSESGERRQVTALFADMVGFVSISDRLGEEATFALIQQVYRLLIEAVKEEHGWVRDFIGDGVMALFGAAEVLEDAPLHACRSALLIQERMANAAPMFEKTYGVRPEMRIGLNSGPVVIARILRDDVSMTALGDTVNMASRLEAMAEPGCVYLNEGTRRLVDGRVETSFVGALPIKGKTQPQNIYRLEAIRPDASRFTRSIFHGLSAYVGRERELARLERALDESQGEVRIVDVVAEPGMGKSRLLYEFRRRSREKSIPSLQGGCTPDGRQTPFRPFIEAVRDLFQVGAADDESESRRKLANGLADLGLDSPQNLALMLNLIGVKRMEGALEGLDGVLIGLRTREVLQHTLQAMCRRSPVVLLIEDIHWIDGASEEVLGKLVGDAANAGLLIVHARRPEYRPSWLGRSGVTTLRLDPLPAAEIQRLIETRLGVDEAPESLVRLVTDKADGNALFAEEIVTFLVESTAVSVGGGEVKLRAARTQSILPASIQLLLTARVASLPPEVRQILQIASVIGRSFDPALLAAVVGRAQNLESHLASAQAADLLRRDEGSGDFSFKHALVRDALYESMLTPQRVELHLQVGREIERRRANQLVEVAELLAHHYSFTAETGKAFAYLGLSGRKSLGVYSLEEAERHFRAALAVVDRSPDCASHGEIAAAAVSLLETLHLKGEVREEKAVAERYIPVLEQWGPSPQFVFALYFQSMVLAHQYDFVRAEETARRALNLAEELRDPKAAAYARQALLFCSTLLGRWPLDVAEREGAVLIADAERAGDNYVLNWAYWSVSWDYVNRGLLAEARGWAEKLTQSGLQRNDRRALALAHWTLSWIDMASERFSDAVAHADECVKTAVTRFDVVTGAYVKATGELLAGRAEESLARLREQREWLENNGWIYSANGADCSIATALGLSGHLKEAIRHLEQAIAVSDAHGDVYTYVWNRITLAEIYLAIVTNAGPRPPLRVILSNAGVIVSGKVHGVRRALELLEQARGGANVHERGVLRARIDSDMGLLLARKRKFE